LPAEPDFGAAPNPFFLPPGKPSGDTFPFYKDGVRRLFHMSMPVIGRHASGDLIHWEERPVGADASTTSSSSAFGGR
jgi:hypothetical protein